MKSDIEKLGKIVQIAKLYKEGHEKNNAIGVIKNICKRNDLNFDDVMAERHDVKEFLLKHKKDEFKLAIQVIAKYGLLKIDDDIHSSINGRYLKFKSTEDKFIETENAYEILSRQYKKERKKVNEVFSEAFTKKHGLYYKPKNEEEEKLMDKRREEQEINIKKGMAIQGLASGMDDVHILKQLTK